MSIPRNEYPRPQLVRNEWLCLNGEWEFLIDNEVVGLEKGFAKGGDFPLTINVPFCPESKLSGIGNTDFMNAVWYRKKLTVPAEWKGKRIILHIGAADFETHVFVGGKEVGSHIGGYTPFSFDITDSLTDGENTVTVYCKDDTRSTTQPTGKQSTKLASHGCYYTRTTGIWQTVWLEPVSDAHVRAINYISNISASKVTVDLKLNGDCFGKTVKVVTSYEGRPTGEATAVCNGNTVSLTVALSEKQLWEAGNGRLYDAVITVSDENGVCDSVQSYFGLREVGLDKKAFRINGKKLYGRWVLDQGFYPDGVYTAPTDEDLKNDIIYSMQLGFNGARLHEKVFEPRFLYWADKLGYLVWDEYPNWGVEHNASVNIESILPEWLVEIERDSAHPSVIGWCPYNETWKAFNNPFVKLVYLATKAADPTRPCIDTSGNYHTITDIFDVHDYEQDPEKFKDYYSDIVNGNIYDQVYRKHEFGGKNAQHYAGEPVFVSEYGGTRWSDAEGWGYGNGPKTEEEFIARYKGLTEVLLFNENILGFCYTQLYDVEQEQNGLMTYDRKFKFDPEIFRKINTQKAAIED